jgi:predicted O-linked N-acetylglucosamine transferase (SPINDLY family)
MFDIWRRLLAQLPGSVLWLKRPGDAALANLKSGAQERGVDPARLVLADNAPLDVHLARYGLADLFLDTLPYNAHATSCDALWGGLPVLTCQGTAFAGRVAASLLHAVGLPELITETPQAYEAMALTLARNPALLKSYRARLAARDAPLFDTAAFARRIEAAYAEMLAAASAGTP